MRAVAHSGLYLIVTPVAAGCSGRTSPDAMSYMRLKRQENTEPLRNKQVSQYHKLPFTGGASLCFDLELYRLAV